MKRLIWKGLNAPLFILLVIISIGIVSAVFNSEWLRYFQPDIVLIAVIWCALRRRFTEGGMLTLVFSMIAESHSSAPRGFMMICFMLLYLSTRAFSRYFVISSFTSLILVTMAAAAYWKITHLCVLAFFNLAQPQFRHTLIQLVPSCLMAGITGIWAFKGLEIFDRLTFLSEQNSQLMEDDLLVEDGF